jgi:purine-binding chemotaxis protein CheW
MSQVLEFSPDDVEAPPAFGTSMSAGFLVGLDRAGKKFVLLLDMDRVLSGQEGCDCLKSGENRFSLTPV